VNRTHFARWAFASIAATFVLGGCSMFHHRDNYYAKARETKPLEVPPDLDSPVSSTELAVPPVGGTFSADSAAMGSAPPAAAISGGALRIADTVDHAWQRVGLALERAQVGAISARDASAHSYTVEVSGLQAAPATPAASDHHWYSRILHPFGGGAKAAPAESGPVSGKLTVTVNADGDGARVEVNGPEEAARRVLEILRQRLS
jgi:uncharacterized lipoprotein